jgi:hypothetical protein
MTERQRLPNRRAAETFEFEAAGLKYTATVGFAYGRIIELFLNNHKSNSAADTNARDAAITFSIAIQHGGDPNVIRGALSHNADATGSSALAVSLNIVSAWT